MSNLTLLDLQTVSSGEALLPYDNIVTLSPEQFQSGVAHYRHRDNPLMAQGLADARGMKRDEAPAKSLCGSLGEVAVALVFGAPLSFEYNPAANFDFVIQGLPVDVKCSPTYDNLLVPAYQIKEGAVYFAAHRIADNQIRLIGWATEKELREKGKLKTQDNKPPAYWLSWRDLHPFRKLIAVPKQNTLSPN